MEKKGQGDESTRAHKKSWPSEASISSQAGKKSNDKNKATKKKATDDCGQIDSIVGGFGRYQFMIFIFKILIGVTSAFNNLGVTFYAPSDFVSFWCADNPQAAATAAAAAAATSFNNTTSAAYDGLPNQAQPQLISSGSGLHTHTQQSNVNSIRQLLADFVYNDERALRHESVYGNSDTPRSLRKECDYLSPVDNKRHKCTSFQYDTGIWMSTIIDEWNLVCERSLFISLTQSLYMGGFIVSFLVFGYLSDRYGRWNSLLLGSMIEIASGFGCAFSGSVFQFMVFRFLLGLGCAGRSSSSYLIMIEWTGQSWRMHISTLGSLGWVIGYCAMPWMTMYFLHFRHMQLFACFYESVFLLWLLFLPESPRWLLTHKRFSEAHSVLLRAAKFNGLLQASAASGHRGSKEDIDASRNGSTSDKTSSDGSLLAMSNLGPTLSGRKNSDVATNGPLPLARKRLNSIIGGNTAGGGGASTNGAAHEAAREAVIQKLDKTDKQQVGTGTGTGTGKGKGDDHLVQVGLTGSGDDLEDSQQQRQQRNSRKRGGVLPYTLDEFEIKFARLAETIASKEFTSNEDKLSILDLFKWPNLRRYGLILAFAWALNSFIYYGIALNVGKFGGRNLFVAFSIAGASELPSIIFTMICMKMLPRKATNVFLFAVIFLLCALQVPLKYYELGWLQQSTMILAKLFNSCSFTVILYQTMELFPTSIRQTAYSSCALAGRIGSILAPFIKELSQMTNNLVPPVIYAVLSLMELVLIRDLPETQGSDLPDTLLEAEKFKGTDAGRNHHSSSAGGGGGGKKKQLPA